MTLEVIRSMLGWCTVINWAILLFWFLFLKVAHDWVYRLHCKCLDVPVERFDSIHYGGMMAYKLAVLILNFVPYIALRIVG